MNVSSYLSSVPNTPDPYQPPTTEVQNLKNFFVQETQQKTFMLRRLVQGTIVDAQGIRPHTQGPDITIKVLLKQILISTSKKSLRSDIAVTQLQNYVSFILKFAH